MVLTFIASKVSIYIKITLTQNLIFYEIKITEVWQFDNYSAM